MKENKTKEQTRRRFLMATGSAATAVALSGCSSDSNQSEQKNKTQSASNNSQNGSDKSQSTKAGSGSEQSKTFRRINSSISSLDPIAATSGPSLIVVQQMYDSLMNYPDGRVNVENLLAKDYQVSDDYQTYTFKLKSGVQFHNGKSLTAKDFVYSFERLAASSNSQRSYFILDSLNVKHETITKNNEEVYKPNSLEITAVNKTTLKIKLTQPFHDTLQMLAYGSFAAIPEGIVGDIDGYEGKIPYKKFAKNPKGAGTGPFKFKSWESGTKIEVTRNEEWHGGNVTIEGIRWEILTDSNSKYNYSINKNTDVLTIPTSNYEPDKIAIDKTDDLGRKHGSYGPIANGETVNYLSSSSLGTFYIGFDMKKIPKPIRQAFAYVLNQKTVVDKIAKGRGEPAYHLTPPSIYPSGPKKYTQHAKNEYPYGYNKTKIDKARQVMEDAGYGPNNKFTANWTQYNFAPWTSIAKNLRDKLAAAHIQMKITEVDISTLLTRGQNGKLEVYALQWGADWPAPDNFLQLLNPPQTDTSKPAPISYINWTSQNGSAAKQATQAYEKVLNNQAPTEKAKKIRDQSYVNIEESNWEDVGFLNVYHGIRERFWYDWADIPPYGQLGSYRQKFDSVKISKRE